MTWQKGCGKIEKEMERIIPGELNKPMPNLQTEGE
jgi:hypothetical protein